MTESFECEGRIGRSVIRWILWDYNYLLKSETVVDGTPLNPLTPNDL
jgi:hypothetical protein